MGALGMMARPRGHEWLEDEIIHLKDQEVNTVVSLLERSESYELGLHMEASLCKEQGITFLNLPIQDRNVPDDKTSFLNFIQEIEFRLTEVLELQYTAEWA